MEYGSTGVLEYWSTGVLEKGSECWSTEVVEHYSKGVVEYWSSGVVFGSRVEETDMEVAVFQESQLRGRPGEKILLQIC